MQGALADAGSLPQPAAFSKRTRRAGCGRPGSLVWQRSARCHAVYQHSHLGEAILDMQTFQYRPETVQHPADSSHQRKHVFRSPPEPRPTEKFQQAVIPHFDGHTVDPADVLTWLREHLMLTRARACAVVTAEETGTALLDLMSVLVLLDEDVRTEDQESMVLFQPVLDIKNKPGLRASRAAPAPTEHWHEAQSSHHHPQAPMAPLVAAMVSKARCPKLLQEQPSTCIAATVRMDSSDVAGIIADAVEEHGSTRLRVANSALGLVAAWRAVRRARAVVRARSGGARDVLCTAQVESLGAPQQRVEQEGVEHRHAGQQQGIMYLNIWRMR